MMSFVLTATLSCAGILLYALGIFIFWSAACEVRKKYAQRIDGSYDLPHKRFVALACFWPLIIISKKFGRKMHAPLKIVYPLKPTVIATH